MFLFLGNRHTHLSFGHMSNLFTPLVASSFGGDRPDRSTMNWNVLTWLSVSTQMRSPILRMSERAWNSYPLLSSLIGVESPFLTWPQEPPVSPRLPSCQRAPTAGPKLLPPPSSLPWCLGGLHWRGFESHF